MPLNLPLPTIQKRSTRLPSSTHPPSFLSSGAGSRCAVLFSLFVSKDASSPASALRRVALRPGSMKAPAIRYTSLAPIQVQPSSSSWMRTPFRKSMVAHCHSPLRIILFSMTLRENFSALPAFHVGQSSSWMARLCAPRASSGYQIYRIALRIALKMHVS